jgi:hypothetical protein
MTIISSNAFTAPNATALEAYTGEIGIGWEKQIFHTNSGTIVNNQMKSVSGGGIGYLTLDSPTSDYYSVQFDADMNSIAANKEVGIYFRFNQSASRTGYRLRTSASTGAVSLDRYNNNGATTAKSWPFTFVAGSIYTIKVITDLDANGDPTFELSVDGVRQGDIYTDTHANKTTIPGRVGVWLQSNLNYLDNYVIDDIGAGDSITVTNINQQVFQRTSGSAIVPISGKYTDGLNSSIASVQAQIMSGATEIIPWFTLDQSPINDKFSGSVKVPEGGPYSVNVRFSNAPEIERMGHSNFFVGDIVLIAGQSNASLWFDDVGGTGAASNVSVYDFGWRTPGGTDKGAIGFGNMFAAKTGVPCGVVNCAFGASALRQEAQNGSGWWLDTNNVPDDKYNTHFRDVIAVVGKDITSLVWIQGERDTRSGVVTQAEYEQSFRILLSEFRKDLKNDIPICINYLGKGEFSGESDIDFQAIRNAQKTIVREKSNNYSVSALDVPMRDVIHDLDHTARAQRSAQSILYAMGLETYGENPTLRNIEKISPTIFDVHINHTGGTDFTPLTAITGFDAFDDGVSKPITSAAHQSASVIRITMTAAVVGEFSLRYQYGRSPNITGDVFDNSPLALPLEWADTFAIDSNNGATYEVAPGLNIPL